MSPRAQNIYQSDNLWNTLAANPRAESHLLFFLLRGIYEKFLKIGTF